MILSSYVAGQSVPPGSSVAYVDGKAPLDRAMDGSQKCVMLMDFGFPPKLVSTVYYLLGQKAKTSKISISGREAL